MEIRQAKKKDIEKIIPIMLEIAELHQKGRDDIFKEKTESEIKTELVQTMLDKNSDILVITKKEIIYGVLIYKFKNIKKHNNLKDAKILWIEELGIKKEYQKQGLGKLLMQKAKEVAQEKRCDRLELNCWNFNENAIEFYKIIGMQEQRINMEIKIKGGNENEVF